jgi:hypothetical protein
MKGVTSWHRMFMLLVVLTGKLCVSVLAGLGVHLRLLSTRSEAVASPDPESDCHTIIRDTEKGTGELVTSSASHTHCQSCHLTA